MRPYSRKYSLLLLHVMAWLGFAVYEQLVLVFTENAKLDLLPTLLNYFLNAGLFYTNSYALLPRLHARRYAAWYYGAAALGLLVVYALLRCELYLHLLPAAGLLGEALSFTYAKFWLLSLYRGSFFLFVSTGYWFARNAVRLEVQKLEQEQQLRTAERHLMEANLTFLKSQINPHFLFNALNFMYAQVYPHSEKAAKAILLLADTMRYALHEDKNGKVMLAQEVQYLHNYIALNQLRFNNQLQINFEVVGNVQFLMILPLVLITFVENCFKHGELTDPANPLSIRLAIVQNRLTFETRNKKCEGPREKSTGIGLDNARKRLNVAYKDQYSLTVGDDPNYYSCSLIIAL